MDKKLHYQIETIVGYQFRGKLPASYIKKTFLLKPSSTHPI